MNFYSRGSKGRHKFISDIELLISFMSELSIFDPCIDIGEDLKCAIERLENEISTCKEYKDIYEI